jgi:Mg-chelatase subunit ChlD
MSSIFRTLRIASIATGIAALSCGGNPTDQEKTDALPESVVETTEQALTEEEVASDGTVTATLDMPDTQTCEGTSTVTLTLQGNVDPGQDIVFLMDASGSVGNAGWELEKTFVADLVETAVPEASSIGIVQFSTGAQDIHALTDAQLPRTDITDKLDPLNVGGWTHTSTAFEHALDMFDVAETQGSTNERLVILITDGKPLGNRNDPKTTAPVLSTRSSRTQTFAR